MDIAPAIKLANPATTILLWVDCAAATPKLKLAVETMPSLAPRTEARSQPVRWAKWFSKFGMNKWGFAQNVQTP